ncbi:Tobamovirus multiplication protein 1 [Citrus sinensis]|nr:Tobamovirus multiplication protein 1 [Citrus sinensis]
MRRITGMPLNSSSSEFGTVLTSWWAEINESSQWQDGIFYSLCAAYALIQLIRIELRVPEYGWTTQKVFHLMNFIVNGVRAVVFGFHMQVFLLHPKVCIWVYLWIDDSSAAEFIGKIFIAGKFLFPNLTSGVIYCSIRLLALWRKVRLFFMLRRFPIESKGRRKKLHEVVVSVPAHACVYSFCVTINMVVEVGSVTAICFTCFLIRCFVFPEQYKIQSWLSVSALVVLKFHKGEKDSPVTSTS